ncbi:MAG: GNAT family N-acetyltransferase [Gemmatimonadales bacterium]
MSPPDGPRAVMVPMTVADIDEVNRVFSEAFTDRYLRDGMSGVRVPELHPTIWRYAIGTAGEGAMLWRDESGVAAFNLAHANGVEGWMGPLAVRPDRQGRGLGREIVMAGVEYLERAGCRRIGLETMPRTVENIGFYSRLGFRPGHLTISMVRNPAGAAPQQVERLSKVVPISGGVARAQRLADRIAPGVDLRREIELTIAHGLGDLVAVGPRGGDWSAFALWHHAPLSVGRSATELRVLKLVAEDSAAFRRVVEAVLAEGARRGVERVAVRCQSGNASAYGDLLDLGFRVHWTDLRMERAGHGAVQAGSVVLSNWEI